MNMDRTIQVTIRVRKYLRKDFVADVLRVAVPIFYFMAWAYRPIALFLKEVVSTIRKILLLFIAILFGFISMIVIFGIPFAFVYGVLARK